MDCLGLALDWENDQQLRSRMREEKVVLMYPSEDKYCKPNRTNAVNNAMVIMPMLLRLQKSSDKKLPHLEDLNGEVTALFQKCGLSTADKAPYKTTVECKRLCGFIKRRAARGEVTKEKGHKTKLHLFILFSSIQPVSI